MAKAMSTPLATHPTNQWRRICVRDVFLEAIVDAEKATLLTSWTTGTGELGAGNGAQCDSSKTSLLVCLAEGVFNRNMYDMQWQARCFKQRLQTTKLNVSSSQRRSYE